VRRQDNRAGKYICLCVCALLATIAIPIVVRAQSAVRVSEPDITANSAIVLTADTGEVLYTKDAELRLPPASLTKLFTALVALESDQLDRRLSVAPEDIVGEASMGLIDGETLSLETLLYGLLLPSGNDAAATIARNLGDGSLDTFMSQANARIAELGLTDTVLINPHGLDAHLHYSSARDLAAITMFLLRTQPDFARISGSLEHTAEGHTLFQTNDLHITYPGLVAGKTGVTDEAGFCLMEVAERNGQRVITVLLGSTSEAWYADAQLLLDYGFATLATPGRLPATDLISIGAPIPVTAPVIVQQSAEPVLASESELQVITVGAGTSLVNEPRITGSTKRSPWLWLSFPLIVIAGVLYALAHVGKIISFRSSRQSTLAHVQRRPSDAAWETTPFSAVRQASIQVNVGDDPDLLLIWDRSTRERLLRGRASAAPSFGD